MNIFTIIMELKIAIMEHLLMYVGVVLKTQGFVGVNKD